MRMRIAAGLVLASTSVMAAGSSVGYETGGSYYRFASLVQQYNGSGELFRIDGVCQSACTLFLAIRNVCIGPNARLLFRAAVENRRRHEQFTRLSLAHYNASLRSYLIGQRAMDQWENFHTVYGGDLVSRFGYRKCPS
jgi:hypothetical protein